MLALRELIVPEPHAMGWHAPDEPKATVCNCSSSWCSFYMLMVMSSSCS